MAWASGSAQASSQDQETRGLPADVLAVIVIFRLSNPSKIQTRTICRRRLLRIFEGSERPKVIILLNQC